jgi:hypothetical protein
MHGQDVSSLQPISRECHGPLVLRHGGAHPVLAGELDHLLVDHLKMMVAAHRPGGDRRWRLQRNGRQPQRERQSTRRQAGHRDAAADRATLLRAPSSELRARGEGRMDRYERQLRGGR